MRHERETPRRPEETPATRPAVAIAAHGLSLRYPDGTVALMPADLQIPVGSLTFLTGASGSGKTSLLRLFMGMVQPTEGTLHVLGRDMGRVGHAEVRRLRQSVGPVFQAFRLIPGRTALENVMSGSRFLPSCSGQLRQEALDVLARVGLSDKTRTPVERLSWGERQRVAIARAVARKPALILADEPTGNLDQENALNILHLLASFRDRQTTVVITTHATHLIAPVQPDFALRLEAGVLVAAHAFGAEQQASANQQASAGQQTSANQEAAHAATP